MLRDEHYHMIAEEFGTNIGVAEWSEPFYGNYTNVRSMPDEVKVALLTNLIIRNNIYQQVHRELWRLQTKYKNKRIKESTLYEKAITNVVERDNIFLNY